MMKRIPARRKEFAGYPGGDTLHVGKGEVAGIALLANLFAISLG